MACSRWRLVRWVVVLLLVYWILVPKAYYGARAYGRVVDATTKQPIAGAAVALVWGNAGMDQILHAASTHTDASGHYELAAWGPKRFWTNKPTLQRPDVWVFKPGYIARDLQKPDQWDWVNVRESFWNGRDIELTPGTDAADYARMINHVASGIFSNLVGTGCDWLLIPELVDVICAETDRLVSEGLLKGPEDTRASWYDSSGCPQPDPANRQPERRSR